jgi:hypothetical protein
VENLKLNYREKIALAAPLVNNPGYLGFFQFVHNTRRRGKALLGALITALVA